MSKTRSAAFAIFACVLCASLNWSLASAAPLFPNSVVSNDIDFIRSDDPSQFASLSYLGQQRKEMPSKFSDELFDNNTYVFEASFTDGKKIGIWCSSAFGSRNSAQVYADKLTPRLGKLPKIQRDMLDHVCIHSGNETAHAETQGHFFILYSQNMDQRINTNDLEETVFHESVHASIQDSYENSSQWRNAQAADSAYITDYAQNYPSLEDMPETALFCYAMLKYPDRLPQYVKDWINSNIPNKLAFFRDVIRYGDGGSSNTPTEATMSSPVPNSTLTGTSVTFSWTKPAGATRYDLVISNANGGSYGDIRRSSVQTSNAVTVNNLPSDGREIAVHLWTEKNGQWKSIEYRYTAYSSGGGGGGGGSSQNYIKNGGFESGMAYWSSAFNTAADFYQSNNPHQGNYNLAHWNDRNSYEVMTYQTVTGLPNGTYQATVWAKSTGGQTTCGFYVYGFDPIDHNIYKAVYVPADLNYRKLVISNIQITNGQCTIAVYSSTGANGKWATFDDFELVRQ